MGALAAVLVTPAVWCLLPVPVAMIVTTRVKTVVVVETTISQWSINFLGIRQPRWREYNQD